MRSIPNWISCLHANSWIFGPFLDILINFLKSKPDLDFPNFLFQIHFESEEVSMDKVVPLFKFFKTIFYFKIFALLSGPHPSASPVSAPTARLCAACPRAS
jgi:hypothetical protein